MRSAFHLTIILGLVVLAAACGSSPANTSNVNKPSAPPANMSITPVRIAPVTPSANGNTTSPASKSGAKINSGNKIDRMAVADDDAPPANTAAKKK